MNFSSQNKYQKGLTLVELMIAMVLSLVLVAGVTQIYISTKQTYRLTEAQSRIQENGRFALYVLSRDIRMADFWGCASSSSADITITNNLDTSSAGYDSDIHNFSDGVDGTEGAAGQPDSITIQGAFNSGIVVETPYATLPSANIKISTGNGLKQGDIVLVSDCLSGDVFQISNNNPDSGGVVVHNTGSATSPGNSNNLYAGSCPGVNAHCLSKVYKGDASIYKLGVKKFYIGTGASTEPALFVTENGETRELVEGVENMQILYGEDTDGDLTPNYYVDADAVTDMEQVVSVKVSLLLHSMENNVTSSNLVVAYNGGTSTIANRRLGRVFSATINIRNRMQ